MFQGNPPRWTSGARARRRLVALTAIALVAQPLAPVVDTISTARAQAAASPGDDTRSIYAPAQPPLRVPEEPPPFTLPAGRPSALPDLGDESYALMSSTQERRIGESVVRQIRAAGAYLDDPEVNDYLNNLGHRLVAAVPEGKQEFEFFAVADPTINAFALPGGYVGVNMGLILLTQTESELAAVLAHEITHVTQHHLARQLAGQQRSLLMSLGALAAALAASRIGGASGAQAISAGVASAQALSLQSQINYTREHEYEADRIGFQRLEAAGFDTTAMATFMERLQKASRFVDSNAPSYLRTHPVTLERIAEAQARAFGKPYRQVPDSLEFQLVRALLRSYQGTPKDAVDFFTAAIADQKYNSEIAARYGLVASLLRAQKFDQAKAELAILEKTAPPDPMIAALGGHVYMEAGNLDVAIKRFEAALARYPNKLQLVYDYPEALLKAGRPRDAAAFLERQLTVFPFNGPLHQIAAHAYAELGRKQQQYRHLGEYYAWQGDLRAAIGQMELAVKAGDGDFYQSSVVETRLRELKREFTEQQQLAKNG